MLPDNLLNRIRELAEAKTVECPSCTGCKAGVGARELVPEVFNLCHGTGRIPDPALAPLLEVVKQVACMNISHYGGDGHVAGCYVTRSWDGLPKGALEGALLKSLAPILKAATGKRKFRIGGAEWELVGLLTETGDTQETACLAVIRMLELLEMSNAR